MTRAPPDPRTGLPLMMSGVPHPQPNEWGDRGVVADIGTNHTTVRISEVGVIEHVEELDAEFCAEPFMEFEVLEYREVQIPEAWVAEEIPSHSAKGSKRRRDHDRVALHVAPTRSQRSGVGCYRRTLRRQ